MLKKYIRFCLTKRVNALLDIADNKKIIAAGKLIENALLNSVNILILIDEYVFEFPAVAFSDRIGLVQHFQRKMLKVAVIQTVNFSFKLTVRPVEPFSKLDHYFRLK